MLNTDERGPGERAAERLEKSPAEDIEDRFGPPERGATARQLVTGVRVFQFVLCDW